MFLSYDEMKHYKIAYKNGEGPTHGLSDIHVNPETGELISYVYGVDRARTETGEEKYSDTSFNMITAAGGAGAVGNMGNMPQGEELPYTYQQNIEYYFIDASKVSVEGDMIYYTGAVKQDEYDMPESLSLEGLMNKEIVTEEGKEVGKIKDVYLEIDQHRLAGIKISEGFWQKLMGDGTKYLPAEAVVKWAPEPVVVKDPVDDYLMDEVDNIK